MEAPLTTPAEWIRGWTAMLDRANPGWRAEYDAEAFALAAEDVFGVEAQAPFGTVDLDLLGEFAAGFQEQSERVCREELAARPEFRAAMTEFADAFRAGRVSDPLLREARARAFRTVVEGLEGPVARRLDGLGRAMDMRDRRARRASLPESTAGPGSTPFDEAAAQEAAARVADRARAELSPAALEAARKCLLDPDGPAGAVAGEEGISAATLSRALHRLRVLSAAELAGCSRSAIRAFTAALVERLR